jgi:hypothetical protein
LLGLLPALQGGRIPSAPQATPEDEVVRAETAEAVRRAVAELAEGQRDAVTLFYLDDRSHREVGAQLGLDVNAVKARSTVPGEGLRPRFGPEAAAGGPLPARPTGMRQSPGAPPTRTPLPEQHMTTTDAPTPIDLEIDDVRRRTIDGQEQYVVVLQAATGERLPIWIGPSESIALALRLTHKPTPRPLTYETMASLLAAVGGRITEILITDKVDNGVSTRCRRGPSDAAPRTPPTSSGVPLSGSSSGPIHPSQRAALRMAAGLSPPTQTGMRGRCSGRAVKA